LCWETYALLHLTGQRAGSQNFFTLPDRKNIVDTRRFRGRESRNKWMVVSRIARWLAYIPSIQLVGVTGALAMGNAGRTDDIDLFIVTHRKTLWITRILTVLLIEILGNRRHPGQKEVANSICLNMFITIDGLALPRNERDLYTAHEVMQMVPVWDREDWYKQFLGANRWIISYLPNWWKEKKKKHFIFTRNNTKSFPQILSPKIILPIVLYVFRLFEPIAKRIQLMYMQKRRTREIIGDSVVRFHPRDTRAFVYDELSKRMSTLNIPLDNVFVLSIK
jgi:hypothetical protein